MKLKRYDASLEEKMSEFDIWVTPSLGEIRDMPQFPDNLKSMKYGFENMAVVTNSFEDVSSCSSSKLAKNVAKYIAGKGEKEQEAILYSIFNVLMLATGKTDNNLKCQYPIMLKNIYGINKYPQKTSASKWKEKELPRTLQIDAVAKIILQLSEKVDVQEIFLESYIHLIISDEQYANQLWCLGNAYCTQKITDNEDAFLSPMVIFQSRGSITATQGHIPENRLRVYMKEWGLEENSDFNTQDVEIGEILDGIEMDSKLKKRKYDFVLPYRSKENGKKIFIQSQFYAGDSGSVSHKVVDQTDSSRTVTLKKYPQAVFVEYLDGAGYFSSLNGDLRKMLAKPTTKDFIQIKSAPLKLRRELQEICFLTTLEIEHAILMTDGKKESVVQLLLNDGYSEEEINRVMETVLTNGKVQTNDDKLILDEDRVEIVRKYCLLDIIANYGEPISLEKQKGVLIVPGYSSFWGMPQADVIRKAIEIAPSLNNLWKNQTDAFDDIQWLLEKGFVISK